ncbi:MAG TPA: response regulator [Polyangiaceae bacterium]|jgi:DNA-binding response OmpR family regulator|nr:response regulator [Polyangiaceae bacterium]
MSESSIGCTERDSPSSHPRLPLVLIVEDTADLRDLFATELATGGFLVIDAADGETALDKARRFEPHAIVLDLMLPGIDGFALARLLRTEGRTRDAAIVAVTALASGHHRTLAIESGCDSCLSKPVLGAEIAQEVTRILKERGTSADLTRLRG